MPVKFHLQAPYEGTKTKNGKRIPSQRETRLYAYLIIDRFRMIKCWTEYVIRPIEWDFDLQLKKEATGTGSPELNADIAEFNAKLLKLKADILKQYEQIRKEYPEATLQQIGTKLKEWSKQTAKPVFNELSLFDVLDLYIEFLKGEVEPGTIKKYHTLKKSLTAFAAKNKKYSPLVFSHIDVSFSRAYMKFLREQEPTGRQLRRPEGLQKGLLNNTIKKYIETLKCFTKWAEEEGYHKNNGYIKIKTISGTNKTKREAKKENIITLTLPELTKFYAHKFTNETLDNVRDVFCFEAFSGQRWSDIKGFDKSQIKGDVWTFTSFKTKKDQELDLMGFSAPCLDILEKHNYKLPVISNQKFNEYLKIAAKEAGIDAPTKQVRYSGIREIENIQPKWYFMSSHVARRTCVSILLNVYNMPISHVMEITQHSDLKTLQKYLDKDREARREAMSKTTPVTELMKVSHKRREAV